MVRKLISVILIGLLCLCLGCRRDQPVPPANPSAGQRVFTDYSIDTFLIQNFLFKAGSYWVYKDSASGRIDSCYCYGFRKQTGTYAQGPSVPGQGYTYYNYRFAWDSTNKPPYTDSTFQYNYWLQGNYIHYGCPYGDCTILLCSSSSGSLQPMSGYQFYPSLTLNSLVFTNVYKYYFFEHCATLSGYIYLKPGVGVVRSQLLTTGKTWNLIRYHIQP
jgi:hypothetical protein